MAAVFTRRKSLVTLVSVLLLPGCGMLGDGFDFGGPIAAGPPLADGPIPSDFSAFVARLWPAAAARGVRADTFRRAFAGVGPDPDVLSRAVAQPEFRRRIWDYLDDMTADSRIAAGAAMLAENRQLFDAIEQRYGVNRYVVAAIWGMESSYGAVLGDPTKVKNVVRALATLAWRGGSRAGYGRQQLIAALTILDRGDIDLRHMTGSWAGAMGHTQFIPTTYLAYAVDFDGDGRRDIWRSVPDALASTANYLSRSGWRTGSTWGYEVRLPAGAEALEGQRMALGDWAARGIFRATGAPYRRPDDSGRLFLPAGPTGPAFLTLPNFDVIKRYNNADAYALAVGHLADRLAGGAPFVTPWPRGYTPLDEAGRMDLQRRLSRAGFPIDKIDGKIGPQSTAAIRAYQGARGLPVDGQPSAELLGLLMREG